MPGKLEIAEQTVHGGVCRVLLLAVGTLTWLVSASALAADDQPLRWKFTAGQTLSYEFSQSTQTETSGTGKSMRVAMEATMTVTWRADSVDADGVASITQTIDRFRIALTTDKLDPIVYDSQSSASPIGPARDIAEGVQPLIGSSCKIRLSPRGEILEVEPSDQLKQAVTAAANTATTGGMLTPDGMTNMLSQATIVLPERPLAAGDGWDANRESPAPAGRMRQQSRYTYVGRETVDGATTDKLTVKSEFTLVPNAGQPLSTKLHSGGQTGTISFDSAAGRFVRSELEQQLDTERPYRDLAIRVRSTSKITMKLLVK